MPDHHIRPFETVCMYAIEQTDEWAGRSSAPVFFRWTWRGWPAITALWQGSRWRQPACTPGPLRSLRKNPRWPDAVMQRQPAAGLGLDDRVRDDRDIGDFPSSVSIRLSRMGWLSPARWVMSAMALVRGRVGRWPGGGRSGFLHEAPGPWKRVVHRCAGVFGGVLVCAIAQRARRSVLQPGSALPQVFAASRFLY